MALQHYDPWTRLSEVRNELDRLFNAPTTAAGEDQSSIITSRWTPAVDVKEENSRFVVYADVPGVDPNNIEVTMENGVLNIRGEREFENRDEQQGYSRVERIYGTFYRRFALPDTADADNISARYNNGVLEVEIPKKEPAQPKRISVKS